MNEEKLYQKIRQIILSARQKVSTATNFAAVESNWMIGQSIVEDEQGGETRAAYGKAVLKNISVKLTDEFGTFYSERNLRHFRQFYLVFPNWNAVRSNLTWTHYRSLMRVENAKARQFYLEEAIANHWNTRRGLHDEMWKE